MGKCDFKTEDGFYILIKSCRGVIKHFCINFASEITLSVTWFVSVFS